MFVTTSELNKILSVSDSSLTTYFTESVRRVCVLFIILYQKIEGCGYPLAVQLKTTWLGERMVCSEGATASTVGGTESKTMIEVQVVAQTIHHVV